MAFQQMVNLDTSKQYLETNSSHYRLKNSRTTSADLHFGDVWILGDVGFHS